MKSMGIHNSNQPGSSTALGGMKSAQALNFRQNLNLSLQQLHNHPGGTAGGAKGSSKKKIVNAPVATTNSLYRAQMIKK